MTKLTDDQLALLKQLEAHGGTLHVDRSRYFDFEQIEKLELVKISVLAGREFHCVITEKGRAAIANPQGR